EQSDEDGGQEVIEALAQLGQIKRGDDDLRREKQANDDEAQPAVECRAGAARLAQEVQDRVDDDRQDGDLHQVARAYRFVELRQAIEQFSFPPLRIADPSFPRSAWERIVAMLCVAGSAFPRSAWERGLA